MRILLALGFVLVSCGPARADFAQKVVNFQWTTAQTATTTIDVTVGFQTKYALVFMGGNANTTDTYSDNVSVRLGVGCVTTTTNRWAVAYGAYDAQTVGSITTFSTAAAVAAVNSGAPADAGRLDVSAIDTDSITFIVDTQLATANLDMTVLAFGGSDITAQNCGIGVEADTTLAHGVGAAPTGVILVSGATASEDAILSTAGAFSIGMCDSAMHQWVNHTWAHDAPVTTDTYAYALSGEVLSLNADLGTASDARAVCASFDDTNVNLTWTESAATRRIPFLAWVGGQFFVGAGATATDTNAFNGPTAGFVPTAAFVASVNRAASTADTPTAQMKISLGAGTEADGQRAHYGQDEDALTDTETGNAIEVDAIYINATGVPAIQGLMSITNWAADPLVYTMSDADPVNAFFGVGYWAANAAVPGSPQILGGGMLR